MTRAPEPAPRAATVRQALIDALRGQSLDAHELSYLVSIREKDVAEHLEHIARSLGRGGERLVVEPASCQECGFSFKKREKLSRPSRCPKCQSERITAPRFGIAPR